MGAQGAAPAPQQAPAPAIRPQSMPGGPAAPQPMPIAAGPEVTTTDPNIIRTQAGGPPPAQQQKPAAANPDDEVIVTPFGRMTRGQARTMGGAFMLGGKPDAGKALLEASGAGAEKFGKEGQNELDKKTINSVNHVSRLREVQESFDPKYLQIPTRIKMAWSSLKSKFGDLNAEQAAELAPFAEFRRKTVENMSRLLNELSGAAISPQEYERIRQTQPDAGTGLYDGDGPVEFEAKMKGAIRSQQRAIARFNYLRRTNPQALSNMKDIHNAFPLEEIDNVIRKRGAEVDQQLRQQYPQAAPAVIQQQRRAILAQEFGLQI
jgi:hypothetical protein